MGTVEEQTMDMRLLMPEAAIGCVIGKGGARIQKIREDTQAKIKIEDIGEAPERLVTITGTVQQITKVTTQFAFHIFEDSEVSFQTKFPVA